LTSQTREPNLTDATLRRETDSLTAKHIICAFCALFLFNLLLRVFYLRYDFVNGDEAVRALTAIRVLEGARLYSEIVTDKPPGATLFYAGVFALFGRSMVAVHLAATVWNFLTSIVVWLIASRFTTRRAGIWAAFLFVYFSTNYLTQDMMAANTELLMVLPYTASFYWFMKAQRTESGFGSPSRKARWSDQRPGALIIAGLLTGVAALFKQVAVLNLVFFALYEIGTVYLARSELRRSTATMSVSRLLVAVMGFSAVAAALAAWLAANGTQSDFWRYVVVLGTYYLDSLPAGLWLKYFAGRGLGYVLFNGALWMLATWTAVRSVRILKSSRGAQFGSGSYFHSGDTAFHLAVTLWGAASLAAVIPGGRFFGHYFIQALPALSLLGARGAELLAERLKDPPARVNARAAVALLAVLFLVGFIRSHHRTAVLAYETLTGARTSASATWGMTRREDEAQIVAEAVRREIGEGEPLYAWDYALDVYWRSRCRPASRYLTTYYITGSFAEGEMRLDASAKEFLAEARRNLVDDLRRTRPRLILDVNRGMRSLPYPEITEFLTKNYTEGAVIGPGVERRVTILRRKD